VRVDGLIASLNAALTVVASGAPVAFAVGVTVTTTGGVVSGPSSVFTTTSTQ